MSNFNILHTYLKCIISYIFQGVTYHHIGCISYMYLVPVSCPCFIVIKLDLQTAYLCVANKWMFSCWLFLQPVTMPKENGSQTTNGLCIQVLVANSGSLRCGLAAWCNVPILHMSSLDGNQKIVKWRSLKDLNSWEGISFSWFMHIEWTCVLTLGTFHWFYVEQWFFISFCP